MRSHAHHLDVWRRRDGTASGWPRGLCPVWIAGRARAINLTEEKRGFARGEIIEILQASPERISPRCKHFGQCGGCNYQHMPYEMQLKVKADILRDQLQRIGKIDNPPIQPTVSSPNVWNYRNHIQFHLDDGKLGFQASASNKMIPISECHLPELSINSFWPQLEFESNSGIERVSIRTGMNDELMLILESDSPEKPELEMEANISAAHVFEDDAIIIAGNDHLTIKVLNLEVSVFRPPHFFKSIRVWPRKWSCIFSSAYPFRNPPSSMRIAAPACLARFLRRNANG